MTRWPPCVQKHTSLTFRVTVPAPVLAANIFGNCIFCWRLMPQKRYEPHNLCLPFAYSFSAICHPTRFSLSEPDCKYFWRRCNASWPLQAEPGGDHILLSAAVCDVRTVSQQVIWSLCLCVQDFGEIWGFCCNRCGGYSVGWHSMVW